MSTEPNAAGAREEGGREGKAGEPSIPELFSRVVLGLTNIVQDAVDLAAASIREELTGFGVSFLRRAGGLALLLFGWALTTAGVAVLLHDIAGIGWSWVLLILGGAYLAGGLWLVLSASRVKGGA